MPTTDLELLFRPRAVAIIGASSDVERIGGQPLKALLEFGYTDTGKVYPVNPNHKTLMNVTCYPDISSVPRPCDLAVVIVPAPLVSDIIEMCGAAGVRFAIVLSSGFGETGESGMQLQGKLAAAALSSGVRIVGPNCQGVLSLSSRLFCGFGTLFQKSNMRADPLAMVTQSGGFGTGVVRLAQAAGIGFNYFVSTGNEASISALDFIEYLIEQDDVEIVTVYLEGVKDGRRLLSLGERALELGKPILVMKVGNSTSGMLAALSHTANLTSGPELYRAVFKQGGFIEIEDIDDLIDAARAFLSRKTPRGCNTAVVTASGGAGVLLADRCEEHGLRLPQLSNSLKAELRKLIPAYGSVENPIDVTAQLSTDPDKANYLISLLLNEPDIDQIILSRGNAVGKNGRDWANGLVKLAEKSNKPIFIHISTERAEEALAILNHHRIPWFLTPGHAVKGAAALYEFALKRERRSARQQRVLPRLEINWPRTALTLGEHDSKNVLDAYGIAVVKEIQLSINEVMALTGAPLPFPLAVKVDSPDIPHKTEAHAVRLGIGSLEDLKDASLAVIASARQYNPDAHIQGVLIQEMVKGEEFMVGVINDAVFGPIIAIGLGGIFAEALRDVTHRCAPVDVSTALVMIGELKGASILKGLRGRPAADVDALAIAISNLSMLAVDHADRISEIDVNPIFVRPTGHGIMAADALIVLKALAHP